jgi:DNA-binding response OmpR family regulator
MDRHFADERGNLERPKHVLLVFEDERALELLVSRQSRTACLSVARNGLSGVEKFCRAIVRDQAFDTVIAQFDMTVLTGLDVLRRVRSIAPTTNTVLWVRSSELSHLVERLAWVDDLVTGDALVSDSLGRWL